MKKAITATFLTGLIASSCTIGSSPEQNKSQAKKFTADTLVAQKGYSEVNGIKMYYEIYGAGKPLVLIHGGGSTIETT